MKNGVDFALFAPYARKQVAKNTVRKKIGYIGSLDHRFDIDTVEYAIQQLQQFDFEFTGNLRNENIPNRLEKYSNVRFYSSVTPDKVPALLAKSDVGIIPYIANEINKNIYPLKINEYLAVGVPVVMTAFAELPEFEKLVAVADTKEKFVENLLLTVANDSTSKIQERIRFAECNSWENKAEEFSCILQKVLETKRHQ